MRKAGRSNQKAIKVYQWLDLATQGSIESGSAFSTQLPAWRNSDF